MPLFAARRTRIAVAAVAALLAALLAGLWLGVPAAVRWGIETVGAREVGRALRVGGVRFNPFTLRLSLKDLVIEGAAGESMPLASVGELSTAVSLQSLLNAAPVVRQLQVQTLRANVVRTAPNRFNFSDIVDRMLARPSSPEPARFAVYNITLADGRVDFDDRVLGSRHVVDAIGFGIPFLSSLPDDIEVEVQPSLSARINGTPLALTGETRPFDASVESTLRLKLDGLDLPTYLPFLPLQPNFALSSGKLDTDLELVFRRATPARNAEVLLAGRAAVREFALAAPAGSGAAPLLRWKALAVDLEQFAPLADRLALRSVQCDGPEAWVRRTSDGNLNWQALAARPWLSTPPPAATAPTAATARPFTAQIGKLGVNSGIVHVIDDAVGSFALDLVDLSVEGAALSTAGQSGTLKLAARTRNDERIALDARLGLSPPAGRIDVALDGWELKTAERYLATAIDGSVAGKLSARARVAFDAGGSELALNVSDAALDASGVRVRGPAGSNAAADLSTFALSGGEIDLRKRAIVFERAAASGLRASVHRLASGEIGWMRLMKAGASTAQAPAAPEPAWTFTLRQAALERGDVIFEDASAQPPVKLRAGAIAASARNLTSEGSERAEFTLRTTLGSGGSLAANGNARWSARAGGPAATVRIDARNADMALVRPYLAQYLNATLASAELTTRGKLDVAVPGGNASPRVAYAGNLRLGNLRLLDAAGQEELLRWQAFDIDRLDLRLGQGAPLVDLGTIALSDFYARVILSAEGRLNLAELLRRDGEPEPAKDASGEKPPLAGGQAPAQAADAPLIRIGRVDIVRGNVNFTDNFIRPNYTANMTGLTGGVSALASDRADPATLALSGKVDDEAPVEIGGRLNPLAPRLYLDIAGSTKGVDLPRFTPYSAKYAGYAIVKGKLSMDVQYKIEDGKLNASNHLFLDQLTFGDRVDSPSATKLPVLLAVALLKNSRGEIDIRLPISGSLDDPQFSVGGIIVQVIINLLTKIVTAPFTLLASVFGGGEELGYIEFEPGAAQLAPEQAKRLDTLARALADRPALRLDIIGRVDPALDIDGIKRARFEAKLRAAKVRALIRAGGDSVDPAKVTIPPEERPALIAVVYGEEKIPDKPRNALGIARTIPAADMEKLIVANTLAAPEDLRALANERAAVVRNVLEQESKIERDRLFLVEPMLTPDGIKDKGRTTRVDFSLK